MSRLKELKLELKDQPGAYFKELVKFVVGFVLSPLTWWNDLFINVPLAWIFAYVASKVVDTFANISLLVFTIFFLVGYIITNIVGVLMMGSSMKRVTKKRSKALATGIAAGVVYSVIVVLLGYSELSQNMSIVPEWIVR